MRSAVVIVRSIVVFAVVGCGARPATRPENAASTTTANAPAAASTRPAVDAADLAAIDRAVAADPDYFAKPDADGLPPLHRAAFRGDAAAVARMLNLGAAPTFATVRTRGKAKGLTPLHAALYGAVIDAGRRGSPPPGAASEDWSGDRSGAQERRTRGQADATHGPMQFVQTTRVLLARESTLPADAISDRVAALHVAAMTGNAELIELLIATGADVNSVIPSTTAAPRTPLMSAAISGDVDAVRVLLDAGADPNGVPAASRRYYLNMAMRSVTSFRLLLDRGLQLPPDALAIAVKNKRVEAAAEIQRRGKSSDRDAALIAGIRGSGRGPLSPEESSGLLATVRSLLDDGASPSGPDGTGETLVMAITRGRTEVAKLLQERGAKVDWSRLTRDEFQPAKIAYDAALINRLDTLRACEATGMPLDAWGASISGRGDRLRQFIATKQATVAGEAGATALYFASARGHADCVRILLDAGADPNARMPSWDTPDIGPRPLDGAPQGGHADVVRLLLDRGADPTQMTLGERDRAALTPAIRAMLATP